MAVRRARTLYFLDAERRVADPIHPRWYTAAGIEQLNEDLRAPPVDLRIRRIRRVLPPSSRPELTAAMVRLAREVMAELFRRTEPLVTHHLENYPIPEFDAELFADPTGRAASERYLRLLRRREASFRPRRASRRSVVPPIVVFGSNRSAESLRMHALSASRIAWNSLENQRGNAHADYCLDVNAVGAETSQALLDYWWDGREAGEERGLQEAYDTLYHECLHRVADLANPFGPQYGPKGSAKEHYWMEEYEPFASEVERVLVSHLETGRERGLLRRRLKA